MKEQNPYKELDLGNRQKWDIIKNYQPQGLDDYRALDLAGPQWKVITNPVVYEPLMQQVDGIASQVEETYTTGQAITPYGEGEYIKKADDTLPTIGDISSTVDVPQSIIPYGTIFDTHTAPEKQNHPRIPKAQRTLTKRQRKELKKNPDAWLHAPREIMIVDFSEKGGE